MLKEKILIVEDEPDILELLTYNLNKEGYQVIGAGSGEQALTLLQAFHPELIILDWMLPGIDGIEVCKILKQNEKTAHIQILILTAKDAETDIVTGLELGADDYMSKPFSPRVLSARVKALLRRSQKNHSQPYLPLTVGELKIHSGKREVRLAGRLIQLTNMEFRILEFLASHKGWVYTRAQIVGAIRGGGYAVTDRSVDATIVGLRKKLDDHSDLIETVRGVGYRFKE